MSRLPTETTSADQRSTDSTTETDTTAPSDGSTPAAPDGYRRYDPAEEMGELPRSDFFDLTAVFWPLSLLLLMGVSYTSAQIGRFFNIIVLGLIAIAIHEGLHLLAGRFFGLSVGAGIKLKRLRPYVVTYGEFQTRLQTAIILAAPLVVISTFCLCVVFVLALLGRPLFDVLLLGLANIVLAYYDLVDLRFTLNLPEGTKEYHSKGGDVAHYVPEGIETPESA